MNRYHVILRNQDGTDTFGAIEADEIRPVHSWWCAFIRNGEIIALIPSEHVTKIEKLP